MLGSPWALLSLPAALQFGELDAPTPHNRAEVERDVEERTGPTDPRHPLPQNLPPQAEDYGDAQETPPGCAARAQRGERLELLGARPAMMTPPSNGGVPSPLHPTSAEDAPLRMAPYAPLRHGHSRPAAHVAHGRSHLSAQAMDGGTRRAGAGAQEIVPRDEGSKVATAFAAAANAGRGSDGARRDAQENAGVTISEQGIGDDASSDLGTSFATPRGVAIATGGAIAAGEACRTYLDDHHDDSPAPHGVLLTSGAEAIAPGAPQPLRRSACRAPCVPVPSVARSRRRKRTGSRIALRGTFMDRSGGQIHQADRRMLHEARTDDFPQSALRDERGARLSAGDQKTSTSGRADWL
ncbi:unnamed protein product [Closterium sp. NIES-64]|nr:unnamed protein product [Closterium sp. NIES-64]